MKELMDLPVEILAEILSYLPVEDVVSFSTLCKAFYEASQFMTVWEARCRKDYNILATNSHLNFKEVYIKVLHKYGRFIGLWRNVKHNKVFQIEYDKGYLTFKKWQLPTSNDIFSPVNCSTILRVVLAADKVDIILKFETQKEQNPHEQGNFFFKAKDNDTFTIIREGRFICYKESFNFRKEYLKRPSKYKNAVEDLYLRIIHPDAKLGVPMQPGIFLGTYGSHGVECIQFDYSEDGSIMTAVKMTGDVNVPAGAVTFKACLKESMVLQQCQQENWTTLQALEPTFVPYVKDNNEQMFKVPHNCDTDDVADFPDKCIARFQGNGQIAETNFRNSTFIKGHWIIFNEDLCAFLWFDLFSMSIYRRAYEFCDRTYFDKGS